MGNEAPRAVTDLAEVDYGAVQSSTEFQRLRRTHRSFVFPVLGACLVWYFAYVLLADYAHGFMATPVFGNVNVGLLLGLGQFVSTFAITTWYVIYANRKLDPIAEEIRDELEGAPVATRQQGVDA